MTKAKHAMTMTRDDFDRAFDAHAFDIIQSIDAYDDCNIVIIDMHDDDAMYMIVMRDNHDHRIIELFNNQIVTQ